jgi:hypothetical protein
VDELPLPKVTPPMLRDASTRCPRRLHAEFTGELGYGSDDPVNRARVRDALLDAIRVLHATGTSPALPDGLLDEERAVIEHALGWYVALFGTEPGTTAELPAEEPTTLGRRGLRLGGWVDLGIVHPDGSRELRQLTWGPPAPGDPLELESTRVAVLRLVQARWVSDGTLTVTSADLFHGALSRRPLAIPDEIGLLGGWLDRQLEVLRSRIEAPQAVPGRDCAQCKFVAGCDAHPVKGSMRGSSSRLLAGVLSISPTSLETWQRCRREWRNREVLGLPGSDAEEGTTHGLLVHDLLRFVHQNGSCHDERYLDEVLTDHDADPQTRDEIGRHPARCPPDAVAVGHELDWVRASGVPPVFIATGRLDAVWEHDGILEVRDYKTGRIPDYPLREDRRARLQAWIAAGHAARRGLRLRLRYEHLGADTVDDPEPWDPDDDELEDIDADLHRTVTEMRAEREFLGVNESAVCARCRYRSICPDSAVPGEGSWPKPEPAASIS